MSLFLQSLSTREIAVIFWLVALLILGVFKRDIRRSMHGVVKALLQKKIAIAIGAMLLYTCFEVFAFHETGLWDVVLLKDTILWTLGVALVLLMNAERAAEGSGYFGRILLDNLKLILVLEFLLNFYTFSLWIEIWLVPLVAVLVGMQAVAQMKPENVHVKRVIDLVLTVLVLIFVVHAVFRVLEDYRSLFTLDSLRSFLLPILFTVAYLPFLYFFAVLMAYESLFVRIDFFVKDDRSLAGHVKRSIFASCFMDLGKIRRFARECTPVLVGSDAGHDIRGFIRDFDKGR